jgi:ATP-dependent helicase/nuclease subunit B
MLTAMIERAFLGWDGPFLPRAAEWLLDRRDALPDCLVVVPTSQSGRRLREAMAERVGAMLAPKVVTPGALMRSADDGVAAQWIERVAWLETLEAIDDWESHAALLPQPPDGSSGWQAGLAAEFTQLRHALQENGLTLDAAAGCLKNSIEADRWRALAELEKLMEARLGEWGYQSRSRVLAAGLPRPDGVAMVVIAGVAGLPPLLEKAFAAWQLPVTVLLAAPESEAEYFSIFGKPAPSWCGRPLPWPEDGWGSVSLVADHRQEAAEALRLVSTWQTPSDEVALGSTDAVTGDELARVFTRAGWPAFHPAARQVTGALARWLKTWRQWLADPRLAVCADLLSLPETAAMMDGGRAAKAWQLAMLRDQWMVMCPDDLRNRVQADDFRNGEQRANAAVLLRAVEALEHRRTEMLRGDFVESMTELVSELAAMGGETADQAVAVSDWLDAAAPVIRRLGRDAFFWMGLMLDELPAPVPQPPDGRVLDVQGWLELLMEPGRHLVLCGINEGLVPARLTGGAWLGENARRMLGLPTDADTAARDAFIYQALLEARRDGGRVDVLCAKTGTGGDALQPSRLLLAAERDELPGRVKFLFEGVEPPEAGLRWHADWLWQPRAVVAPERLPVTSLTDWLACPFRFYLKHALRMQVPEPQRIEWNARDFGTVIHNVLERWGRDAEARELTDESKLRDWFHAGLDRECAGWFAGRVPLAVRLQIESMRQRLAWLARLQAGIRSDGWQTIEVESKFEIPIGSHVIVGKIDRIDRHQESGALRVIDYKTGAVDKVEGEHRKKTSARTVLPDHIPADSPVIHHDFAVEKLSECRWTNLQLPLYAAALCDRLGAMPVPCYITLGSTAADVNLGEWEGFSEYDLGAAMGCAKWIVAQIESREFWPPAKKINYDDFTALSAGRPLMEICQSPKDVGSMKRA